MHKTRRLHSINGLMLLILLLSLSALAIGRVGATSLLTTAITIDGHGSGRTFDGLGGLSGGGGTSRLLIDYPAQQQSEILDYLFKPGYGANLQILKVEIGGDTDTTNGAEASSQRTPTDQNYNRGYEWWLMEQAKLRNPNIKLYGLEWGAPSWFNGGFWSQDNITYITNWLKHAQSDHNLHIDYIGGWNERGYNKTWYENLKHALVANNLTPKVVAADSDWTVATDLKNDSAFNNAVDIVGVHYPCGWMSDGSTCNSTANALSLNKPLWASENGSENYDSGSAALARALNRDYIDGRMTADINWSLVAAWYSNLPYSGDGLMRADQPWSGNYAVSKSIWVMAHTTQFAQPGWQYIDGASGYLGRSRSNGSYITLKSPNGQDYSTIVETTSTGSAQTASFQVTGGLSTGAVHVWATNLNSSNSSDYFVHQQDITPSGGAFSLTLQPGYVYTLTTTTGQGKGVTTPPAAAALNLPYADNFESYTSGHLPKYLSDVEGAFEAATCTNSHSGMCLQQQIDRQPIVWATGHTPLTMMGNPGWSDYTVSTDAQIIEAGHVRLIGRISSQPQYNEANAYYLDVQNTGAWELQSYASGNKTVLASGTVSFGLNSWHKLSLAFQGSNIKASIDSTTVASINNATYRTGSVGLGTLWNKAQFDNFSVTPLGSSASYSKLVNRNSGLLLDVTGQSTSDGALIQQWQDATPSSYSSEWQLVDVGGGYVKIVNRNSGKVLDVSAGSKATGVQIEQWTDNGGVNQQWQVVNVAGGYVKIINRNSGLALDVSGGNKSNGGAVIQWTDNGAANQQWSIVAA